MPEAKGLREKSWYLVSLFVFCCDGDELSSFDYPSCRVGAGAPCSEYIASLLFFFGSLFAGLFPITCLCKIHLG